MGIPTGPLQKNLPWPTQFEARCLRTIEPQVCFLDMYLLCLADLLKVQTQNTVSLHRRKLFSSFSSKNKSIALRYSQGLRYVERLWFPDSSVMGFVIKWLHG